MSTQQNRKEKAEQMLRWRAVSALMLLAWVVLGPFVAFALFKLKMKSVSIGLALACAAALIAVNLRIYFSRCPNCSRFLYIFRVMGAWSKTCRHCRMSLEEMASLE
jgi:hypothetical protein